MSESSTKISEETTEGKQYVAPRIAMAKFGICRSTLINWRKAGVIKALPPPHRRGHWRYDISSVLEGHAK